MQRGDPVMYGHAVTRESRVACRFVVPACFRIVSGTEGGSVKQFFSTERHLAVDWPHQKIWTPPTASIKHINRIGCRNDWLRSPQAGFSGKGYLHMLE